MTCRPVIETGFDIEELELEVELGFDVEELGFNVAELGIPVVDKVLRSFEPEYVQFTKTPDEHVLDKPPAYSDDSVPVQAELLV